MQIYANNITVIYKYIYMRCIDELIYFGFKNLYLHIFMEFPNSLINLKNFY